MQSQAQKPSGKKAEFYPNHMDWFVSKGVDLRLSLSSAMRHERDADKYGKVLRRKSLKSSSDEMDGYLRECRLAGREFFEIAKRLAELKGDFLSDPKNAGFSPQRYDSIVEGMRKKAAFFQKFAWSYEKAYADKYGPREEYRAHLLVRDIARQLREEMEKNAGKMPPSPVYGRASERPALARNSHSAPAGGETHALVVSFAQELQRKYKEKPAEGGEKVARASGGYRRGYERAGGQKYINIAAEKARRDEAEMAVYHRGERQIRGEPGRIAIARRSVPAKSGVAGEKVARLDLAKPRTWAQAQREVDRVKKERAELSERISSLSGAEKKKASEELLELSKELYRFRKMRDSLV